MFIRLGGGALSLSPNCNDLLPELRIMTRGRSAGFTSEGIQRVIRRAPMAKACAPTVRHTALVAKWVARPLASAHTNTKLSDKGK